ncbi:protein-tyrosine phosphatase-like protein [Umbelopsis sp. PMI_123]|nr:protein-tyrosine phosphatase-like protein [Umbelopsis sp. PMI_123]
MKNILSLFLKNAELISLCKRSRIDELVILGALPTPTQIKEMQQQQNLKTVINLCAEFPGYRGMYNELGIHQMCIGTTDYTVPSLEKLEAGVAAVMDIAEHEEGSVYIHCKAGRGRSAALGLCYLIRRYQLNPQQAQDILLKARTQVDKELYQAEPIRMYYKSVIMEDEAERIHRVPYTYL